MGEGGPESFHFLGGDHGFAATADSGADDNGEFGAVFLDGDEGGFGVEGVEDGFDHEDVGSTFDEGFDLVGVGSFDLIEGDGAKGGVIGIDDVGEGHGEGADGTGDVALASGFVADAVGFLFGEFDGLNVQLADEILKHLVIDDFTVEEFRVFFAAGLAGVLDEEFGLGEDGSGEGVGFADVGSGLVEALVDVADDIGAGEGEDVAVIEEVFMVVLEAIAAGVGFVQFVAANGGAHRSIEDHDAFRKGGFELAAGIVGHRLAFRAQIRLNPVGWQVQIYASRYVDGFAFCVWIDMLGKVNGSGQKWLEFGGSR